MGRHVPHSFFLTVACALFPQEFRVSQDYNSVTQVREYLSHQNRVTSVIFCPTSRWVLSVARDKFFVYHCTESGRRLGGHQCPGCCTALQFDAKSKHAFVGDYSGQITMLKLEENGPQVITVLKVSTTRKSRKLFWYLSYIDNSSGCVALRPLLLRGASCLMV